MIYVIPSWFSLVYVSCLGLFFGSFLNVVIARLPEGESIVRPRSRCPKCKHGIAWYDNIPVVSYLILRGKCRHCGDGIAFRYPMVELLMGALAGAIWLQFGWSWNFLIWFPLTVALMAITFLDIDHWWVPDVITLPAIVFVGLASFLPGGLTPVEALLGLLPAVGILIVAWVFMRITGREGLGFGDVKLLALLGLAVGLVDGIAVVLLASLQGVVVGIIVVLTGGHNSRNDEEQNDDEVDPKTEGPEGDGETDEEDDWVPHPRAIPFGPFLVLGALEVVLLPEIFGDLPHRLSQILVGWLL